jgi:hypothetical protein
LTLKRASNLLKSQARGIGHNALSRMLGSKKVNPALIESILLNSEQEVVINRAASFLRYWASGGKKSAFRILTRTANEKFNLNQESRLASMNALFEILSLDAKKEKEILPMLIIGVSDSNYKIRQTAVKGLKILAKEGIKETTSPLFKAANDDYLDIRELASSANLALAKHGVKEAAPGLIVALMDERMETHVNGAEGLDALIAHGENLFPMLVKVYKNKKANERAKQKILRLIQKHIERENPFAIQAKKELGK